MRRSSLLAMCLATVASAPFAGAAPKKAEPEPPPLPAPEVKLRVEPAGPGKPWRMVVTNEGSTPLRLVADARLLRMSIDVPIDPTAPPPKPTKKALKPPTPKPIECGLPGSMREDGRVLVLQPGAKYVEVFDPRLYCLDAIEKIAPGSTVQARLGWPAPEPKKGKPVPLKPPFVVAPVPSANGDAGVASAKQIAAAPFAIDVAPWSPPKPAASLEPLVAKGGAARSVVSGKYADASVILRNTSASSKLVYARPQLVEAKVVDPRGNAVACTGPGLTPAPIIDFATRLAPTGTWSASIPLAQLCPPGTFDVPGLYLVTPIVHLPKIPDAKNDWSGDVTGDKPQMLRVETGKEPFHLGPATATKNAQ